MASLERQVFLIIKCLILFVPVKLCVAAPSDIELDAKAQLLHKVDSLNLLVYTCLLSLTVLTTWLFKHRRFRYLHETGLAVIYGLIIGAIIRYTGSTNAVTHLSVRPENASSYNLTLPPDSLWLKFKLPNSTETPKSYSYLFRGELVDVENNQIDLKATFDPEIFFNIILPPIIFHAGYSLKRRHFFRNLGAILTYALVGTTISSFVVGSLMYGCVQVIPQMKASITFLDTLYFGAIISSTDPLTVLAIFNDLQVDVNLYALIFGESVLNDAVSIVLSGAIQHYGGKYESGGGHEFRLGAFFMAVGEFIGIFSLSLLIGAVMGCLTALLTKFTRVRDFPLLESALFLLMSYSTFLIAEVSDLVGIVAVLFCGICQAHYTYNNLSNVSRTRTKHLFELLNFLAENFIFCYIGVSMFTFPKHQFNAFFIISGFICALIGRAANIYPLSFLLNLGRKPKISRDFQHMLFFVGLRGAMSFALAIRNTVSEARQAMLTTTSLIVIITVIVQGGATMQLLSWFRIPIGVREETELLPEPREGSASTGGGAGDGQPHEKARLARVWGDLDNRFIKPLLTDSRPTLRETLPVWCSPLARLLTTTSQMTQGISRRSRHDSDSDADGDETVDVPPAPTISSLPRALFGTVSERGSVNPVFCATLKHGDVDDDSLENALEAIERRQRDLRMRENYGQPENIGYGFQKNLGLFETGPARFLGASREADDYSPYEENLAEKRTRSSFRERNAGTVEGDRGERRERESREYLDAVRSLWERYQHQRPSPPIDLEQLSNLSDVELLELLSALQENEGNDIPVLPRAHRSYRVFDSYGVNKRSPSFGRGLYAKRQQRLTQEEAENDPFLYSLKWVNPASNREGVEALRAAEPWAEDRDGDIAAILSQSRYPEAESWLNSQADVEDGEYGNEHRPPRRSYRLRDRKRAPVKRNAVPATAADGDAKSNQASTSDEVKGIFGNDSKNDTQKTRTINKKLSGEPVKKTKPEKKVVRRAEPSQPGEIAELFQVQKKSVDWSKHFGVNKRMYVNPFDTRVFNTKRNLADNLQVVENRLGGVEDRILDDAVKLTGAHGDEGLDTIREGVLRRIEAAYSLEKMRAALDEYRNSVNAAVTENPQSPTSGKASESMDGEGDDGDKSKRVAIKKEGAGSADLEFLNWDRQPSDDGSASGECELLEVLVDNCMRMEESLGKFAEMLTPACTLHQICYTCGPEFGFSRPTACDLMFLNEAQHLCNGKPECVGGARETVSALREMHDRLEATGPAGPAVTCRANPCVADHFLTSPSGVVTLNV